MGRIEQVRKRDGSLVGYDEAKLERSIDRAFRDAGHEETPAQDLAEAVSTYLRNHFDKRSAPTSEEIREMVRKVLVETGYPGVADTYAGHERSAPPTPDLFPQELILVDGGTRDESERWRRDRIAQALIREAELDPTTAERIAGRVEAKILALKLQRISTNLVRELVNHELLLEGRPVPLERQRTLGVPKADLREMLASGAQADPDALCRQLGELTLKQFALQEIYSREVADAHLDGRIHIHSIENPLKLYWGRFEAAELFPEPGGVSDPRLARLCAGFAEALEIVDAPAGRLPQIAAAVGERESPRVLIGSLLTAEDHLPESLPVRLNVAVESAETARKLATRAVQRGGVLFLLRGPQTSRFADAPPVIAQAVSVNLPQTLSRGGGDAGLYRELEEAVAMAVLAHEQKRIALRSYTPSVARGPMRYSVGVQGLAELTRQSTGRTLGVDEDATRWALQVLGFVQTLVRESAVRAGMDLSVDDIFSHRAVERFARIDQQLFGAAGEYTSGAHAPAGTPTRARLQVEARLGTGIGGSAVLIPREERPKLSAEEFVRILEDASRDRRIQRVLVV